MVEVTQLLIQFPLEVEQRHGRDEGISVKQNKKSMRRQGLEPSSGVVIIWHQQYADSWSSLPQASAELNCSQTLCHHGGNNSSALPSVDTVQRPEIKFASWTQKPQIALLIFYSLIISLS